MIPSPLPGRAVAERAGLAAFVVATTALIVWRDAGPGALERHLYIVPTVWAAVRFGLHGGVAIASLALSFDAPFLMEAIETWGLDRQAVEGLVTFGLLLLLGGLAGSLADRARRQLERYQTVLALQRSLGVPRPLAEGLEKATSALQALLLAEAAEVLVRRDDGRYLGVGGPRSLAAGTAAAWVAEHAQSLYLPDAPGTTVSARPRRVAIVPLVVGGSVIGVAGVERATWVSRDDRAALAALGAQIALALENVRLKDGLESKIAAATHRLSELDRAKSEFVSIASHELRTPLTSLRGFSELLLTRRYAADEARRFLAVIHAEAERLGRLLDDLLDLGRIESGQRVELQPVPVPVRPLLEAHVERFEAQSARRRFRIVAPAGLPPLLVDRDAVERILTNLLSNAVKYSPAGSEIRLLATAVGERVEVSVEDEGVGIPEAALARICDRYYRVPGGDHGARGLGLGLALVKSLVESSGGEIRVESTRGAGSRFTLSLPRLP